MKSRNCVRPALGVAAICIMCFTPGTASAAEEQVNFADCKVRQKNDGFRKSAMGVKLITTKSWYKKYGFATTRDATLRQHIYPTLNAKFGKGKYKVECAKIL